MSLTQHIKTQPTAPTSSHQTENSKNPSLLMGGNGKHGWKISFYSRLPKPTQTQRQLESPPKDFLCPIPGSLMSDPVVVSSGQTFERVSVQVFRDLGVTPILGNSKTTPSELTHRVNHFYSSSSEESIVVNLDGTAASSPFRWTQLDLISSC